MAATLIRDDKCCANCGAPVSSHFCEWCGQKSETRRLDIWTLLVTGFRALLEFDNKIWRTVRGLTLNPGKVALEYIGGARIAYINPIKYLLATIAIGYALVILTGELDRAFDTTGTNNIPDNLSEEQLARYNQYMTATKDVISQFADLMSLITVPIFALCMRLQNYRQGKNYAEVLTFVSYIWGHASLISIPITIFYAFTDFYWHWTKLVVMVCLIYWGNRTFYNRGWLRNIVSTLGYAVYFMLIYTFLTQLLVMARLEGWI